VIAFSLGEIELGSERLRPPGITIAKSRIRHVFEFVSLALALSTRIPAFSDTVEAFADF